MANIARNVEIDAETTPNQDTEQGRPELDYDVGELAPCWFSPYPDADLTGEEEQQLKQLVDQIGNVDVAARRWEVESAWMNRLFDRGMQYLFPKRGGGWLFVPFATDYQHGRSGSFMFGNETNITATYGEIVTAALTRDIPGVRFEPQNPSSDADITAKDAATNYARIFARTNDLLQLHQQLSYYLRVDGRAMIVTDHIIDAQQFGRCDPEAPDPVVPETDETEAESVAPFIYFVRHGETELNQEDKNRGRSEVPVNDKGERQMDRASDWLKDKEIKLVVSSPVERALTSAQIIAEKLGVRLEVDDRLASLDTGATIGEDSSVANEDIKEAFDEHPGEPIAGGESPEEFQTRVEQAVMDWLSNPDKPVAVIVHDSVISQIFKMFQGEAVPPSSNTEPGWVVAISPNPDGTFKPSVVYPVTPPETSAGEQRGRPRGQEVSRVYGKLEHKVPFNASSGELKDCQWAQVAVEYDVTLPKAMFPDKADKIKPGGAASGENELDRIARINATLALEASYVTGDSMVRDCTVQRTWLRPAYFMNVENVEMRRSFLEKFPDGALVIQAGDEFIKARNECMDDHLTLIHAFPGSGMNRLALMSKIISVNKRLNNWMDLLDQYFVKCVPMRYIPSGPFDVNAIQQQGTVVGGYIPYVASELPAGHSLTDLIFMEPYPTAQPLMGEFIKWFTIDLPQLLTHALPSLFGSVSNSDPSGVAFGMQRDQALESNSTPWHNIQMATSNYFRQAAQLAARCRTEAIQGLDKTGKLIRIELADMKGNILCYPDSDANFPESWGQKQSRWAQLIQDAANPLFTKLMTRIQNRIEAIQGIGLPGVKDPDEDSWQKQMGEFEILLKSGPAPNPEYLQAQQAIQQTAQQIRANQGIGVAATQQEIQAIQQMEQQLQTIPPQISSVPVKDTDDHEVEAATCLEKIRSPEGRELANGTKKERAAFDNLVLHYQEHSAKIKPTPELKPLPKGISANLRDMPSDAAANLLTATGLETQGADVVQNREFSAELRKSGKVGGPPVPGVQQ